MGDAGGVPAPFALHSYTTPDKNLVKIFLHTIVTIPHGSQASQISVNHKELTLGPPLVTRTNFFDKGQ
jgi:hypothetical protein